MKKTLIISLLSMLAVSSSFAKSGDVRAVTIVNHFNDTLNLTVSDHKEIVPDLPEKFTLHKNEKITTRVLLGQQNKNEAYIIVEGEKDPVGNEAFWGVDSNGVHGYVDTGIAFSWNDNRLATIIFCTPEDYAKNGECL